MKFATYCALVLFLSVVSIDGQAPPVVLPQIIVVEKHMEIVSVPGATPSTQLTGIKSRNTSVATATLYRANQVQIVAVAQGRTEVEFTAMPSRQQYVQPVWVEKANATGGGSAGLDPTKTQLDQIVMAVKRTRNVAAPGSAASARVSGVKSSNPSVATARANPPRGIQIYAVALGDTFIEFSANGVSYQVHVFVTETGAPTTSSSSSGGSSPPVSGGGGGGGGGGGAAPAGGAFGPCLTGSWVSESVAIGTAEQRGGSGIKLTYERNGRVTIDYSEMQVLETYLGTDVSGRSLWRGKAVYQVKVERNGSWTVTPISNEIIYRHEDSSGQGTEGKEDNYGGPGAILLPKFTCSGDSLTYRRAVYRRAS